LHDIRKPRLLIVLAHIATGVAIAIAFDALYNRSGIYYKNYEYGVYLLTNSVLQSGLLWTITSFTIPSSVFAGFVYGRQRYFVDYLVHAIFESVGIPINVHYLFGMVLFTSACYFYARAFCDNDLDLFLVGILAVSPPIVLVDLMYHLNATIAYSLTILSLSFLVSKRKTFLFSCLSLAALTFTYLTTMWLGLALAFVYGLLNFRERGKIAFVPFASLTGMGILFQPNSILSALLSILPMLPRTSIVSPFLPPTAGEVPHSYVSIYMPPHAYRTSSLLPLYFVPFIISLTLQALLVLPQFFKVFVNWIRARFKAPGSPAEIITLVLGLSTPIFGLALFAVRMHGRILHYAPLMLLPSAYLFLKSRKRNLKMLIVGAIMAISFVTNIAFFSLPPNYVDFSSSEIRVVRWATANLNGTVFVDVARADLFYLHGYYDLQGVEGDADPIISILYYSSNNSLETYSALATRKVRYVLLTDNMFKSGLVPLNIPTTPISQEILEKFLDQTYFEQVYAEEDSYIFRVKTVPP